MRLDSWIEYWLTHSLSNFVNYVISKSGHIQLQFFSIFLDAFRKL
jgi:hypothetical protein